MAFLPAQGLPRLDGQWRVTTEVGWVGEGSSEALSVHQSGEDSSQSLLS